MLFYLIHWVVTYNIESFQMISEEYFEVVVMGWMEGSIDIMIVSTSIRGILYLEIFHKDEVLDNLHIFNFSIFPKK